MREDMISPETLLALWPVASALGKGEPLEGTPSREALEKLADTREDAVRTLAEALIGPSVSEIDTRTLAGRLHEAWRPPLTEYLRLCRAFDEETMMTVLAGLRRPLPVEALEPLLRRVQRLDALAVYQAQMTWLVAAQLDAMRGGTDFPLPDAGFLAPAPTGSADPRSGLLNRLKGAEYEHSR